MIPKEKADAMVVALYNKIQEAAAKNNLSNDTLAECAGMSRSRWAQVEKKPNISAFCLLRMRQTLQNISRAEEEGWLPASAKRRSPQDEVKRKLLEM